MTENDETTIPGKSNPDEIRFVTFNVNGVRTFFHYYPFSQMNTSLRSVFDFFNGDIISFQELKTDTLAIPKWGKVDGFYSFISIPLKKKGYSGVGCWVRIPPANHPLHDKLRVVKAEEGITGLLTVKIDGQKVRYKDNCSIGLGGYDNLGIEDEEKLLNLDSEGRCVMVELACNTVVINVYLPANSGQTPEGEVFRMDFIKVLFNRIRNFDKIGKNVVLMGDINICRDLIESAESLNNVPVNLSLYKNGSDIETAFKDQCQNYILNVDVPHRRLLNRLLSDSILPELAKDGILIDSTRAKQARDRIKMYTVWNMQKNTRPSNFGSRIDLILISTALKESIHQADILPSIMGSDHCPVYTDLRTDRLEVIHDDHDVKIPKFETRYKYNLRNQDVLSMFAKRPNAPLSDDSVATTSRKRPSSFGVAVSAKRTNSIDNFFTSKKVVRSKTVTPIENSQPDTGIVFHKSTVAHDNVNTKSMKDVFGKPPCCKHGEEAVLKTSRTPNNPGKRFWACKRSRGDTNDKEASCGFFQWV